MKYYPVFLDIKGKKCIVIGGGEVAARKAERLLDCGAQVLIISPDLAPELAEMKEKNVINHIAAQYSDNLIDGAVLIIGATDDEKTNDQISLDCRNKGIPVNIVDDPQKCDFILPSLMQRGDLAIAIGTGGKSPALARHLREELESKYGKEYEIFLNILGNLRVKMARNEGKGKDWFNAMLAAGIIDAIKKRDAKEIREILKKTTGEEVDIEF